MSTESSLCGFVRDWKWHISVHALCRVLPIAGVPIPAKRSGPCCDFEGRMNEWGGDFREEKPQAWAGV